jgi:hypothetical protein
MKYIPGLVPEKHRVLPDYFKPIPYNFTLPKQQTDLITVLYTLIAVFLIIGALYCLSIRPIIMYLMLFIGFSTLPIMQKKIEEVFRFEITVPIKLGSIASMLLATTMMDPILRTTE